MLAYFVEKNLVFGYFTPRTLSKKNCLHSAQMRRKFSLSVSGLFQKSNG